VEPNIRIGLAGKGLRNLYGLMVSNHPITVLDHIARQIGLLGVRTTLEATGEPNQIGSTHLVPKRIFARTAYFARNRNHRRIGLSQVLVNKDAVFRRQQNVIFRIAGEGLAQINAEYLQLPIIGFAEHLHVIQLCLWCCVACKIDRVSQISRSVGYVIAWISDLSAHGYDRRILKVKPPEHPYGVERLQHQILIFARQSIFQTESQYLWGVVWRLQTNDLSMPLVRLWQKILV